MDQTVKPLSTMRETRVQSLGWEDPLEKEMEIHSRTEEPGRLQPMGSQRVRHDWATSLSTYELILNCLHLQNGSDVKNPPAMRETCVRSLGWEDLLEKGMASHSSILAWRIPMDRRAWRARVHGVTKSRTWLKQLSTHTYNNYIILIYGVLFTGQEMC